jgi:molybdate transport system ATP-binding protein
MSDDQIHARFQTQLGAFRLNVDLALPGSGVTAIFGHSGCGKTTLLRCMAGLLESQGQMRVNGSLWQDNTRNLPTHKRPLGYVFQETGLLPHLSVESNLLFGYRRVPKTMRRIAPDQVVAWLGLSPLMKRRPGGLSGGERQRVAIARALLTSPRLLLLDEPVSALDEPGKRDVLGYLERLRAHLDIPMVYVSHSVSEVARLADHLVIMREGKVAAEGDLQTVLSRPDQPLALEDDASVIVPATIVKQDTQWHLCLAEFNGGQFWLRDDRQLKPGTPVRLQVMARDVSIALSARHDQSIQNVVAATVTDIAPEQTPGVTTLRLMAGNTPFLARLTSRSVQHLELQEGASVWLQVKSVAIIE